MLCGLDIFCSDMRCTCSTKWHRPPKIYIQKWLADVESAYMSTTLDVHIVFFFLFLKIYLLLLFGDVYEFMCTTFVQVSPEARRCQITLEIELRVFMSYLMWFLGTGFRSSTKTWSALNHQTISPSYHIVLKYAKLFSNHYLFMS